MAEYIDRNVAIAWFMPYAHTEESIEADVVISDIKSMKAADVAPVVHGKWVFDGSDWSDIWKCSACGDEWFFEYDPRDEETLVKYCPNCGARMDGE